MRPLLAEWHGAQWLLYVATHPPGNLLRLDELAFTSTFTVRPVLTLLEDIERTLRLHGVFSIQAVTPIALLLDNGFRLEISRGRCALARFRPLCCSEAPGARLTGWLNCGVGGGRSSGK
jgi:hypothetical protein